MCAVKDDELVVIDREPIRRRPRRLRDPFLMVVSPRRKYQITKGLAERVGFDSYVESKATWH